MPAVACANFLAYGLLQRKCGTSHFGRVEPDFGRRTLREPTAFNLPKDGVHRTRAERPDRHDGTNSHSIFGCRVANWWINDVNLL